MNLSMNAGGGIALFPFFVWLASSQIFVGEAQTSENYFEGPPASGRPFRANLPASGLYEVVIHREGTRSPIEFNVMEMCRIPHYASSKLFQRLNALRMKKWLNSCPTNMTLQVKSQILRSIPFCSIAFPHLFPSWSDNVRSSGVSKHSGMDAR